MTSNESTRRLAVYPLLSPLLRGWSVLHLAGAARGTKLLAEAGARVIDAGPRGRLRCSLTALPLASGSYERVVAPSLLEAEGDELEAALAELRRVLSATGFGVLVASHRLGYWRLRELLAARFAQVALLAQAPLAGFYLSYLEPNIAAESLALHDELATEPEGASHFVALVGQRDLPQLDPYALVTLPPSAMVSVPGAGRELGAGREAGVGAELALARAKREREGLRQQLADAGQRIEHLRQRVGEAERVVTQVTLERDRLEQRRAALTEQAGRSSSELAQRSEECRTLAATLERSRREQEALARQVERSELQLVDLRDAQDALREQVAGLFIERDRLRERLLVEEEERHREARERARAEQRARGLDEQLAAQSAALDAAREAERQHEALRDELTRTATAYDVLQQELDVLHGERRDLFVSLREQREARAALERAQAREQQEFQGERESWRQQLASLESIIEARQQDMARLEELLQQYADKLSWAEEQHAALVAAGAGREQLQAFLTTAEQRRVEAEAELAQAREIAQAQAERAEELRDGLEAQGVELAAQSELVETLRDELEAAAATLAARERIESQLEAAAARERRDLFRSERREKALSELHAALSLEHQQEVADLRHELLVAVAAREDQADELAARLARQAAEHALEVDVRATELAYAFERLEQLEGRFWQASDEATRHAARVAAAAASVENERTQHEALERRSAALEAELRQAEVEREELQAAARAASLASDEDLAAAQRAARQRSAEVETLQAALEQERARVDAVLEELHWQALATRAELWRRAQAELQDRLRAAEEQAKLRDGAELRLAASEAEADDLRAQLGELDGTIEALRQLLQQQELRIEQLGEAAAQAEQERVDAVARAEDLTDEVIPLREREGELREVSARLSSEARALVARYEEAVAAAEPLQEALEQSRKEGEALRRSLDELGAAQKETTKQVAAAAELRSELEHARREQQVLQERLRLANELLEAQSSSLMQLKEARFALKEARAELTREQQRAERATSERGELQEHLLAARRQQAEQRQRDRAQQQSLEQRLVEAETARKRAHVRAVQQDEARRQAERAVEPLEQLVRRLGGDPADAEALRKVPTDVDDRLLADDWHDDLEEAPKELREALVQELGAAPGRASAARDEYDDGHTVRTEFDAPAEPGAERGEPNEPERRDAAQAMASYPTNQGLQALGALLSEPSRAVEEAPAGAPTPKEKKDVSG